MRTGGGLRHGAVMSFPHEHALPDAAEWDERYGGERIWSGLANDVLVTETADATPGRALDVGCGEGADAVWLAAHGWRVTALDVSSVALSRAAAHAAELGVSVTWLHAGLLDVELAQGGFDLVSAQYPALRRTPDAVAERALLDAVAVGGTLLVAHHAGFHEQHTDGDFDPADYVSPAEVAAVLDDAWRVEVDEVRPRLGARGGAGAHHVDDVVLKATRLR